MDNRIKKVLVVGRDADAWLSALILKLSFARSTESLQVELVELPSKLHPHHCYSVLPSHKALHRVLNIDESVLFGSVGAQYALGQQFINWSGEKTAYFHGYDSHGVSINNIDFIQYWIKAYRKGFSAPLEKFCLGAEAAKQGRFINLSDGAEKFSNATYGYHLNSIAYLRLIAKAAIKAGVKHYVNNVQSVFLDQGLIQSVLLDDGRSLSADLYVDASGVSAELIKNLETAENFDNWERFFPCDRQLISSAPRLSNVPAFGQISAMHNGWFGVYPLLNRTALSATYSSHFTSSDEVKRIMSESLRINLENAVEQDLLFGVREQQWIGNCIALGDSAIVSESLDATHLHGLHLGLSTLRLFFPVDKEYFPEADLFNKKMNSYADNMRDLQVSHYVLNRRIGQPFWDFCKSIQISQELKSKINLFSATGYIAMQEDETFQEENWTSILVGHGVIPERYNPLVDRISDTELISKMKNILQFIADEVKEMPTIAAHIEMNSDPIF